jgi:CheY-like chemotaxis protein
MKNFLMGARGIPPKKILVVDDEPLVRDAVKMLLTFDGHNVVTADNAKEALVLFEHDKFDLMITDYTMPAMNGGELAAAVKARVPGQPVILITAYGDAFQSSGALQAKVDQIITKPFVIENLREAVQRVTAH